MTSGGQAQIGNVDLVKQLNSAAVYRLIDQHGPISRIQIAEQSQLAPASVTKITRQLIERGLIKKSISRPPPGAAAQYLLSPKPAISTQSAFVLAVMTRLSRCTI